MTTKWTLAKSLGVLREQINTLAPKRSKASDGTIGDVAHSKRKSDHNPNARGVVNALDITHDPKGGVDIAKLGDVLIASRDPRISYLIFNGQIVSGAGGNKPWTKRKYTGANKHTKHIHISVKDRVGDATNPWKIGAAFAAKAAPKPASPPPFVVTKDVVETVQRRLAELNYNPGGIDGIQGSLTNGAILSFKADNGLKPTDTIDPALIKALAVAKPRKLEKRVEMTSTEVAAKVPEAKAHWWNKWIGGATAGAATVTGIADATGSARGYIGPLQELAADVPGYVWLSLIAVVALSIFLLARKGEQKSVEAFQSGDRR